MTESIHEMIRKLIVETFDLDTNRLPENIDADTIEKWDSLGHLKLIMNIEKGFAISFSVTQIPILWSEDNLVNAVKEMMINTEAT